MTRVAINATDLTDGSKQCDFVICQCLFEHMYFILLNKDDLLSTGLKRIISSPCYSIFL